MKNKILVAIVFLLGVFFPLTSVNALTKINFEEQTNGNINTNLHFDEGFVGAIDIDFKVTGDVYVKNFKFSDKITTGNYKQEYKYDENKRILTIRVTSGGIGTKHNLLNEKKELTLGTISFDSTAKSDVKYKLSETEFKIVNNKWASKTIKQSEIELGDQTEFVYNIVNSNNTTNENQEKDDNVNNSKNSDVNKSSSSKSNTVKKESKTTINNKEESKNDDDVTENNKDTDEKSEKSENKSNDKNKKSSVENNNNKTDKSIIKVVIPSVIVLATGTTGFFLIKKRTIRKR